jgi:ABC-type polysaccharide/polyol phosphate export permease
MGIFVAALGALYAKLFNRPPDIYIPHLTLGFLAWTFLAGVIGGGCNAFIGAERYIKEMRVPLSAFVYRMIWQHVIMLCYQSLVYVAVAVIFNIRPGPVSVLAVGGVALFIVNAVWVGLLMGILATRYRDVPEIMNNVIRIVFFLTPILWMPEMAGGARSLILELNPFYHFIELIRAPLLGNAPHAHAWLLALGTAVVGWPLALLLFARFKGRIAYWL